MVDGVNLYQILRWTLVWQDGSAAGSPVVVASVMSAVTAVRYGNGPAAGITSAPAHKSLVGATFGARTASTALAALESLCRGSVKVFGEPAANPMLTG